MPGTEVLHPASSRPRGVFVRKLPTLPAEARTRAIPSHLEQEQVFRV